MSAIQSLFFWVQCLMISIVSFLFYQPVFAGTEIKIVDVRYINSHLSIKGKFKGNTPSPGSVRLYDALTQEFISAINSREQSSYFSLQVYNLKRIPCYIKVQAAGFKLIKEVEFAPVDCSLPAIDLQASDTSKTVNSAGFK